MEVHLFTLKRQFGFLLFSLLNFISGSLGSTSLENDENVCATATEQISENQTIQTGIDNFKPIIIISDFKN